MSSFLSRSLLFVKGFGPSSVKVSAKECFRAALGALFGIFITAIFCRYFSGAPDAYFIIAPMGASAVLLFAVPSSPLAQPWSVFFGNTISAVVGVASFLYIQDIALAAAVAVSAAIALMSITRSLHPPGGAIALYAVLGGADIHALGFTYALLPVAVNSLLLIACAILFNNLTRHRYPHRPHDRQENVHKTKDTLPTQRADINSDDLDVVLEQYNEVLDVNRDDLEYLLKQMQMQSYRRRFENATCGSIMSKDVISLVFESTLKEAWAALQEHKISSLPVLDDERRLIGILTLADFMMLAKFDEHDTPEVKLFEPIQVSEEGNFTQPSVVGDIMTTGVCSAHVDDHIVDLVPTLSDAGLHNIPVVDSERRIQGMVTQSDLVAALYRINL